RLPPIAQAALGVDLASLVIEAMREFVADDRADRTIVHSAIRIHIEYRRLKYRCRKDDVAQDVIHSVDGLRRDVPFATIDCIWEFAEIMGPIRSRTASNIPHEIVIANRERRIVAPLVGIPNLDGVGVELF